MKVLVAILAIALILTLIANHDLKQQLATQQEEFEPTISRYKRDAESFKIMYRIAEHDLSKCRNSDEIKPQVTIEHIHISNEAFDDAVRQMNNEVIRDLRHSIKDN